MSYYYGPSLVKDGLVLCLDAANPKSYVSGSNTWRDLSGKGNNGSQSGGIPSYNSKGYFDFSVYNSRGFSFTSPVIQRSGGFTLMAIIRRSAAIKAAGDRENIFGNTSSANGWRFGINSNGSIYYLIGGETGGYAEGGLGGTNLYDGNWHIIAAVYDREASRGSYKAYGYIDGKSVGNANIPSGNYLFANNNASLAINICCSNFGGDIANVTGYNKALSDGEILQNFNSLKGRYNI